MENKYKPQVGELCWFWSCKRTVIVNYFREMQDGYYISKSAEASEFCRKFEGERFWEEKGDDTMSKAYEKFMPVWVADINNGVFRLSIWAHIVDPETKEVTGYILNDGTKVMGIDFLNYGRRYSGSELMAKSELKKLKGNQKLQDEVNNNWSTNCEWL